MEIAKNSEVSPVLVRNERLNSLILEYAKLQRQESDIRKAKEQLRAEIGNLFPPIKEGMKDSRMEVCGITAKLYYPEITTIDPAALYQVEEYRDFFWRSIKVPLLEARAILPKEVLDKISYVEVQPLPQLLIQSKKIS